MPGHTAKHMQYATALCARMRLILRFHRHHDANVHDIASPGVRHLYWRIYRILGLRTRMMMMTTTQGDRRIFDRSRAMRFIGP
mgnify:CR=1 FL=1